MSSELELNAAFNASLNILASGIETIKNSRREYRVPLIRETLYSVKRQNNTMSNHLIGYSCM